MDIQHNDQETQLAGIISSISKNPESWQEWLCLQLSLNNDVSSSQFEHCIGRCREFLSSYLGDIETRVFYCRSQNVHIFCKNVSKDILHHAGQQLCELLFDEEALLSVHEVFDLGREGFYYVSYALELAAGQHAIPASAYSSLDPFTASTAKTLGRSFNEKLIVNHKDLTKVLLVEDDPVTRWMVRKGLKHDCQLVTAPSANQSFDRFNSFQPDIVFLDIDLPDKSGREVLTWIMRNDPGACVVMFSSNNDLENISETLSEGASGFIAKPFLRDDLLHYIHAHSR